jgi:D-threonate/D-erythronate kinase
MRVLILADDLSGAADCALGFTRAGRWADVLLHANPAALREEREVVAVDTDTRPLPAPVAAERSLAAYRALREPGQRLYKKIDSTLRGPWAAEVAALQAVAGIAIVAPAFPSVGRTVRDGRVFVQGQPLEDTATWKLEGRGRDAGLSAQLSAAGMTSARIDAEALREQPEAIARLVAQHASQGVQALVVDAQSEQALRTLARATLETATPLFWVGSGGLAQEIAALLPGPHAAVDEAPALPGPVLTAVGSVSVVSERQCALLRERAGLREIVVPLALLRAGAAHPEWMPASQHIGEALASGTDLLLRIGREQAPDMAEAARLAVGLAELVAPHFGRIGALIATGGETARAILTRAGVTRLHLLAEIEPGVPLSRVVADGSGQGPHVVTKAGAFGLDEALYHGWQRLRALRQTQANHQGGGQPRKQ